MTGGTQDVVRTTKNTQRHKMNRTTKSAGVGQHSNGMRRKHPRTPSPLIPFPSRSLRLTTDAHQVRRKIEFILCRTEHSSFRFLAWSAASPTLFNIDTYKPCLQNVAFRAREDAVSTKSLNGFCCVVSTKSLNGFCCVVSVFDSP